MTKVLRILIYIFSFLIILAVATLRVVDRTPPRELPHYTEMMERLDSLSKSLAIDSSEPFQIGYAKVSITPDSAMALAGYGARRPKAFEGILDSIYIRTLVIKTPTKKVAILTGDLLIIHPLMTRNLHQELEQIGWAKNDVFLTATHTHSSIGQWAPGLVGGLFAGEYDEGVAQIIAERMRLSISEAEENIAPSHVAFTSSKNPDLVLNRLVQDRGIEDPFQKNLTFRTAKGDINFSTFSAHATCLTKDSRKLSGDFPSYFHRQMETDSTSLFSIYAAGPVGSMGPETGAMNQFERAKYVGKELANRLPTPIEFEDSVRINTFRIPIALGQSQFKIAKNLALRPYLFSYAFGDEPAEISLLQIGNVLIIGTPCDFSGELAVPLYAFARKRGFELIITSFNGGYIGYITKDEWYDLEKYESRTMSWYGPGNGAYFSEIIQKVIDAVHENS